MIETKKRYLFPMLALVSFLCMCFKSSELRDVEVFIHSHFLVEEPKLAIVFSAEEIDKVVLNPPFIGKSFVGFKEALAYRESRGNYFIVNRYGYMGKYQFGKSALKFFGVKDRHTFLNSPEQQERLFELSLQRNKWVLRNEIEQFTGKVINGIEITESGILAAAHLAGAANVKKFLKREGKYAFADANGTTLQNYLKHFAGYDVAHIIPEKMPKFQVS